jgi:hypothetical protein
MLCTTPIRIGQSLRALELAQRTAACCASIGPDHRAAVSSRSTATLIAITRVIHCAPPRANWTKRHHPPGKTATIPLCSFRGMFAACRAPPKLRLVGRELIGLRTAVLALLANNLRIAANLTDGDQHTGDNHETLFECPLKFPVCGPVN